MGHLFLDIETYAAKDNGETSLNPYEKGAKVILIAYNYYTGFKPPSKEQIRPPIFLKEWESNEKEILQTFYAFLSATFKKDPYLKITGFNILKFDLPYLFGRMKENSIATERELHDLLFRPFGIDLFQMSALLTEKTQKYEQLWGISHKDASKFFGLKAKEGNGLDCSDFYDKKEFDKILNYSTEEFNFEQLLDAFYLYAIGKKGKKEEVEEEITGAKMQAGNRLADQIVYQEGSVVSKTIMDKTAGTVTLFAFDAGQGLSEHTAPFDALVHVLEGAAEITIAGKPSPARAGELVVLPANKPHSLKAVARFKMLLTMIRAN
jgi:quercetin dioxygenase-like cupin family protein